MGQRAGADAPADTESEMSGGTLPKTDNGLKDWAVNADTKITADPPSFGRTVLEASAYHAVVQIYVDALALLLDPATKTHPNVIAKNEAKKSLSDASRLLIKSIQADPNVSDATRAEIFIEPRKPATPIPVPPDSPELTVKSINGRTVVVKLKQPEGLGRGKPAGVACAAVYAYWGPEPVPDDITKWESQGTCSNTEFTIDFPLSVPGFSKVYLTAAWKNPRQQAGPLADPIFLFLGSGLVTGAA